MLSQTAEYALRAMVCLADHRGEAMTNQALAEVTRVPVGYLHKVMQQLARAGLVQSQRGLHGGFTLTVNPSDVSVLDVLNAVDPIQRIHHCPLGLASHGKNLCPLHRRLDDAAATIEKAFKDTSLADVLGEETTSKPLCDGKKAAKTR